MESDKIPNNDSQFLDVPFCLHDPVFLFANDVSLIRFPNTIKAGDVRDRLGRRVYSIHQGNILSADQEAYDAVIVSQ